MYSDPIKQRVFEYDSAGTRDPLSVRLFIIKYGDKYDVVAFRVRVRRWCPRNTGRAQAKWKRVRCNTAPTPPGFVFTRIDGPHMSTRRVL